MLHTIPILLAIKIQKPCKDFQKTLDIKTGGTAGATRLEVIRINKNNGRCINDRNSTRETELQKSRVNQYFKVPARDYSNSKQRYSERQRRKPQKPFN